MTKSFVSLIAVALLATALVVSPAWAQRGGGGRGGGGGGGRGGGGARPSGGFGGGVRPGNFGGAHFSSGFGYRSFYAPYGFAGFYTPYYGSYWPSYYASYVPYYGGLGLPAYPLIAGYGEAYAVPVAGGQAPNQAQGERPRDGAAHLQLTVPENAEVLIDGTATTQTGAAREFVTPQLNPGSRYVYKVTVRSRNAAGKVAEDTRDIRFQADDWFSVDFTRPPPGPPPAPLPLPKTTKEE